MVIVGVDNSRLPVDSVQSGFFLWPALRYRTGYQTVWEIWPSAETPSGVHWRRFYFQLSCVNSALELSGWCALQNYLLTYLLGCLNMSVDSCLALFNIHYINRETLAMTVLRWQHNRPDCPRYYYRYYSQKYRKLETTHMTCTPLQSCNTFQKLELNRTVSNWQC